MKPFIVASPGSSELAKPSTTDDPGDSLRLFQSFAGNMCNMLQGSTPFEHASLTQTEVLYLVILCMAWAVMYGVLFGMWGVKFGCMKVCIYLLPAEQDWV